MPGGVARVHAECVTVEPGNAVDGGPVQRVQAVALDPVAVVVEENAVDVETGILRMLQAVGLACFSASMTGFAVSASVYVPHPC